MLGIVAMFLAFLAFLSIQPMPEQPEYSVTVQVPPPPIWVDIPLPERNPLR